MRIVFLLVLGMLVTFGNAQRYKEMALNVDF
jgi:hypothetical protein